jgi:tocopherol cyclase
MDYFRNIFNPHLFQGKKKKRKYFEGWYFRHTNTDGFTISFIPGISLEKGRRHSFIQILVSGPKAYNIEFPHSSFSWGDNPFSINIGDSTFSEEGIIINAGNEDIRIKGSIRYGGFRKIRQTFLMPNIMGFFAYLPFMECSHGVISMGHSLTGSITINGTEHVFDGGRGYIEKDWGRSFPKSYAWVQCSHFDEEGISMMFSVARIPFAFFSFKGFLANLVIGEDEYRFATYNRSKIKKLDISDNQVRAVMANRNYRLAITATAYENTRLNAPKHGKMDHMIKEGINGQVSLVLSDKKGKTIYSGKGVNAGIEIVRELEEGPR